jgi:hypothetical protein
VGEGRAAIVLQWAEQRVSEVLVRGLIQIGARVIAAEVKSKRGDRAGVVRDVRTRSACVQNGVPDIERSIAIINATAGNVG